MYATDFSNRPVNQWINHQFRMQRHRGTEGFGVFDGQFGHLIKNPEEGKILRWLKKYPSSEILFHHRMPTSTANVKNACHPFSTKDHFETNYILIHNGWISNAQAMAKKHTEMGIAYSSEQPNGDFNDSEALLWEVALYLEGKQDKIESYGPIAFICIAIDKDGGKKLYFARNSNPINMHKTKKHIYLSSEGNGQPIPADRLHVFDFATKLMETREFDVPNYYTNYTAPETNSKTWYHGDDDSTSKLDHIDLNLLQDGLNDEGWLDKKGQFHYWSYEEKKTERPQTNSFISPNQLEFSLNVGTEFRAYLEKFEGNYFNACNATDEDILFAKALIEDTPEDAEELEYQIKVLNAVQDRLLSQKGWTTQQSIHPDYVKKTSMLKAIASQVMRASNA